MKKPYLLLLALLGLPFLSWGQFNLVGDAVSTGPDCFRLTRDTNFVAGAAWSINQVDISQPFDVYFDVFLGCNNANGADGIAFVLQPLSSSIGGSGIGIGYQGISPSLAVEFDNFQNTLNNDPAADHIAIMANGNPVHNSVQNLAGPTPAKVNALGLSVNVEDCNWHSVRISWAPSTNNLRVWFDCDLRLSYTGNILSTIFNNNPSVHWGFTAATGTQTNEHRVCFDYISFTDALADTAICLGDSLSLDAGAGNGYLWAPATGLSATNVRNPIAHPSVTTRYRVTVTDPCGNARRDSILITVEDSTALNFSLGSDTTICTGNTITLLPSLNQTYLWQDSSLQTTFTTDSASWYWAEFANACGIARDSQRVDVTQGPNVDLGPDLMLCPGQSVVLDLTSPTATSYQWVGGPATPTLTVSNAGTYVGQASNSCGTTADTVTVAFFPTLSISLGADTTLCQPDTLLLSLPQNPGDRFLWSTGDTTSQIVVRNPGLYWVFVRDTCGALASDSILVEFIPVPFVDLGPDTTLCDGASLRLEPAASPGITYFWSDASTQPFLLVSTAGLYWVQVSNACGSARDSIEVLISQTPEVDLGPDLLLCAGESASLEARQAVPAAYLWQDGSQADSFLVRENGIYWVLVFNACGSSRDTVQAIYDGPPDAVDLGPDLTACEGDTLMLEALSFSSPTAPVSYLWSTGETEPVIFPQSSATYSVTLSNRCGEVQDAVQITFEAPPNPDLGADSSICTDALQPFVLDVTQPGASYRWQDGSTASVFSVTGGGVYFVEVSNSCGTANDTLLVEEIDCSCQVFAPTAFSPNDDGHNDVFQVFTACRVNAATFQVFDRWGRLIFSASSLDQPWDGRYSGKTVQEGVYVWTLNFQGEGKRGPFSQRLSGSVTLIR